MDRSRNTASSVSSKSFFGRSLIRRESTKPDFENDTPRGPLGLTTVHAPEGTIASDLIFVHGLNGDSRNTWSRNGNPNFFWPKEWLPQDSAFQDVRIHTFGYSSAILKESGVLNIPDFSRSLLGAIQDAPTIPQGENCPLVFVGHSMGGLVIKKAYILGHQIPEFNPLVERVKGVFFLATPHQGADIAVVLSRLLALIPGSRPGTFVSDLLPGSPVLQSINDEFPRLCDLNSSVQLFSFFETKAMNYGVGRGLIVDKHCAVMNYPRERRMHLDANHRDVARFPSTEDPSYLTVRNALAAFIDAQRRSSTKTHDNQSQDRLEAVHKFLGVPDAGHEDVLMQDSHRLQGSGDWLFQKNSFNEWRNACSSKILWLRGRPGAGKSFLAGNVVKHLRQQELDCASFFFDSGDSRKSNISAFLRSMAFQMAILHPEIFETIVAMSERKDAAVNPTDHNTVWRQLYLSAGILKAKLPRQQYWIIDAMDECKASQELLHFLVKAQELWPLCILVTSRDAYEPSMTHRTEVLLDTIDDEDSAKDISLFLQINSDFLPASSDEARTKMAEQILEGSRGCFLWANLIVNELRQVHTAHETNMVLASTPSDMNELYHKILDDMSRARFGKDLAKAILVWTTCSSRPLFMEELHAAIETDISDNIDNIERSVKSYCGNLVYMDSKNRFQLIHTTVREFLLGKNLDSEFAINKTESHTRIARVCLRCLIDNSRTVRRPSFMAAETVGRGTVLLKYASEYLFHHLGHVKSTNNEILSLLAKFFTSSSILTWIEHIARLSDLRNVYLAGKTVLNILDRRVRHTPDFTDSLQMDITKLRAWAHDLIHLTTRFSHRMKQTPTAIHTLIPPFCPSGSIIRKQFCAPNRGLSVSGTSNSTWDTCLTTIQYEKTRKPLSSAIGDGFIALGMNTGEIILYDDTIFQEVQIANHNQPVWMIQFGENGKYLASSSAKSIKLWSMETWNLIHDFPISSLPVSISFMEKDTILMAATRRNEILRWDLIQGCLKDDIVDWTRDLADEDGPQLQLRQPTLADFSIHRNLLAIVYRGEDIFLWDTELDRIHDMYEKDTGSRNNGSFKLADGATTVKALTFSAAPDTGLLAATYSDGDLIVYDTYSGDVQATLPGGNTLALASSPDGRTLVGADTKGDVLLFDFETLRYLYRISIANNNVMAKFVNFTNDGQRIVDVRAPQCRVWQPTVLIRHEIEDDKSDTVSLSIGPQEIDYQIMDRVAITAMCCVKPHSQGSSVIFCGKEDGSVHVFNITNDSQGQQLFVQSVGCAITETHFDDHSGLLTCSDRSSRVTSRKLSRLNRSSWSVVDFRMDLSTDLRITQVMGNGTHGAVLVASVEYDGLWGAASTLNNQSPISRVEGSKSKRWIGHPTNPDLLLFIRDRSVEIRSWANLDVLATFQPPVDNHTLTSFHCCIDLGNTRYFATSDRGTADENCMKGNISVWDFNSFPDQSLGTEDRSPICTLSVAANRIETVIGLYSERLVYIDSDYWITSIDISDNDQSPIRHFFIPNDWLSLVDRLSFELGKLGELIFIKQSDLVVIRRGLEITETGAPFNPRRRSSTQMPFRPGPSTLPGRHVMTT